MLTDEQIYKIHETMSDDETRDTHGNVIACVMTEEAFVKAAREIERIVNAERDAKEAERIDKITTALAGIAYMYDDNGCIDFGNDEPEDIIKFILADFAPKIDDARECEALAARIAVKKRDAEVRAIIREYDGVLRELARESDSRDEYNGLCERIQSAQALSERLFPETPSPTQEKL